MRKLSFALALLFALSLLPFVGCGGEEENTPVVFIFAGLGGQFPEEREREIKAALEGDRGFFAFFSAESHGKAKFAPVYADAALQKPAAFFSSSSYAEGAADPFVREQYLVRSALRSAEGDFGSLKNGRVSLVLVLDSSPEDNGEKILWPHKSELTSEEEGKKIYKFDDEIYENIGITKEEAFIGSSLGKAEVVDYAIVSAESSVGQICHEFSHIFGLADYYPYEELDDENYDRIGGYELMGSRTGKIPQFSLAYLRAKLGWLEEGKDIAVTSTSGKFALKPVTEGGGAVKIVPPDFGETGAFFMAEARKKEEGEFDDAINATALILYTVRPENAYITPSGYGTADRGNMYGAPEIKLANSGGYNYFDGKNGRDNARLSDAVEVKNIAATEDGFTFEVEITGTAPAPRPFDAKFIADGNVLAFDWEPAADGYMYIMAIEYDGRAAAAYSLGMLPSASAVKRGRAAGYNVLYTAKLDARSRMFVPKLQGSCIVLAAGDGGERIVKRVTDGDATAEASFADFFAVLCLPPNPAFFALCAFSVLCVLAGLFAAIKAARRKKRGK